LCCFRTHSRTASGKKHAGGSRHLLVRAHLATAGDSCEGRLDLRPDRNERADSFRTRLKQDAEVLERLEASDRDPLAPTQSTDNSGNVFLLLLLSFPKFCFVCFVFVLSRALQRPVFPTTTTRFCSPDTALPPRGRNRRRRRDRRGTATSATTTSTSSSPGPARCRRQARWRCDGARTWRTGRRAARPSAGCSCRRRPCGRRPSRGRRPPGRRTAATGTPRPATAAAARAIRSAASGRGG
jgi:hypothetical protein